MNTNFFEPRIVYKFSKLIGVVTATVARSNLPCWNLICFQFHTRHLFSEVNLFRKVQLIKRIFQKFAIDNIKRTNWAILF